MATQDPVSLARGAYEAFNRHDVDSIVSVFSDQFEYMDYSIDRRVQGANGFKQYCQDLWKAFPDAKVEIKNIFGSSNYVVTEYIFSATNKGPMMSKMLNRQIPATNKKIDVPICEVTHYENGKVMSIHAYSDALTVVRQLGLESQLGKLAAA